MQDSSPLELLFSLMVSGSMLGCSHLNQHAADIMEAPPDGSHEESNPCSRGTNTYVFLSWKMADSHELNLPISKLDFYIPG